MAELALHRDYLENAWRAAQAAPLSTRKLLLVAMLIDAFVDRQFAADPRADDILVYRAARAAATPDLGLILALCERRAGFELVTEAVAVPLADYAALAVEDFMVSLYNDHSVQRVRLVSPDGQRRDMLEVLGAAMDNVYSQVLNNPTS